VGPTPGSEQAVAGLAGRGLNAGPGLGSAPGQNLMGDATRREPGADLLRLADRLRTQAVVHRQGRDCPPAEPRPACGEQTECEAVGPAGDCDREMGGALEWAEGLDQASELGVGQAACGRWLRRSLRAPVRG
jgi:hypothetical protein